MESSLHNTTNQSFNIIKALNDNIKQLHTMMEVSIGVKDDMENEGNRETKYNVNPLDESPNNRTRMNKKKRGKEDSPDDIQLMIEADERMEMLEVKVFVLVKNTMP